jgi:hypothetical protein
MLFSSGHHIVFSSQTLVIVNLSLNSCFGAESLSHVFVINNANGFQKDKALSNICLFHVNGGLLTIISRSGGS